VQALGLDSRRPGAPVIVFEAGATNSLEVWGGIVPEVAALAPVVAYDRAGLGRSDWDLLRPTPQHVAARLRQLLDRVGAAPPYVLVGYSWGGVLARYFAGVNRSEIAGLVFVDPGPIITQSLEGNVAPFDAIGAGRSGYEAYWSSFAALFERASPAIRAEFDVLRSLMDQALEDRGVPELPAVPVTVIVSAKYLPLVGMQLPYDPEAHFRAELQHKILALQDWALESPDGVMLVSNRTTHAVPREAPDLIVWAVRRTLFAVEHR
jgi:pimeloyl-ACP methyl ester carboxylesterase